MTDPHAAMPVALVGSSIFSKLTAAGVWTAVLTLIGLYLRSRVPMRKLKIEAEEQLRVDLMARMGKMEADHTAEKIDWSRRLEAVETRLDTMRTQYEAKLETERTQHELESRTLRHRMANLSQCLESVLTMIEMNFDNPEKIKEGARRVREMRTKQELQEAQEKVVAPLARIAVAANAATAAGDSEIVHTPSPARRRNRRAAARTEE